MVHKTKKTNYIYIHLNKVYLSCTFAMNGYTPIAY